jgi:hypothetical protein
VVFDQFRQARPFLQRVGGSQARRDVFARLRVAGLAAE